MLSLAERRALCEKAGLNIICHAGCFWIGPYGFKDLWSAVEEAEKIIKVGKEACARREWNKLMEATGE